MEWINAKVLVGLIVFVVYQKNKISALEKTLSAQREKLDAQKSMLVSHKDMLFSQKEILSTQKDLLISYKDALDDVKANIAIHGSFKPVVDTAPQEDNVEFKQRGEIKEEKAKFQKELQEKKKTIEWYEKEFLIGLDALLELFLHLPLSIRQKVIKKMPASVLKKGFKRLSDSI